MSIADTIVLFAVCSLAGWVWESFYAVIRTHGWERRGFLYGPVCPIYGVGVVGIIMLFKALSGVRTGELEWWQVFLVSFVGSMVLEYVTSWTMERLFHAYWWDYSGMPLNIQGRTCVPAGLLFGGGGLLAIYVVLPAVNGVSGSVPEVVMQVASYLVIAVVSADLTLTVSALTDFQKRITAAENYVNLRASAFVADAAETAEGAQGRLAAERDKLVVAATRRMIESMSELRKGALDRVRGFRGVDASEERRFMARALEVVKQRRRN